VVPVFNTNRMVQEYTERFYLPCATRYDELAVDGRSRTTNLAAWKARVRKVWDKVAIANLDSGPTDGLPFGSNLKVSAEVYLDKLTSDDVIVEIYYGDLDRHGSVSNGRTVPMSFSEKLDGKKCRFVGEITCNKTGEQGFTVRVIPNHPDLAQKHETGLIAWA